MFLSDCQIIRPYASAICCLGIGQAKLPLLKPHNAGPIEKSDTQGGLGRMLTIACRVLGQHPSTQRKIPKTRDDEAAFTADFVALAFQYGRYGYRRITAMLRRSRPVVNRKRVARIWRRRGSRCHRSS